ncbi:DUF624 domain-containing protein [Demequina flava]|uniref:DUF624 domain-containing protein n=1 Tax=Demequina flava TaxID=1095025 RepID=UPI000780D0FA|nr:DUF624 domain-containing protein [Demequina flava]
MTRAPATKRRGPRWELRILDALAYPANIILGALAGLILALPIVTLVPAGVALARSFGQWDVGERDDVFRNTFRHFGQTWRRTVVPGLVGAVVLVVLVIDAVFLVSQLTSGESTIGLVFAAAMVPVAVMVCLYGLALCTASALMPDAATHDWLRAATQIMLSYPARSFGVVLAMCLTAVVCGLLPTLAPFIFMSVPVYAAIRLWPSSASD